MSRERHRDLTLATVGDEELRLQVFKPYASEIETDLFGDLASRGCLEHIRDGMGHVDVAADHSDHARGVLDTW